MVISITGISGNILTFAVLKRDFSVALLAGSLMSTTNRLYRVLNAAARVVSGTMNFDSGLTQLRHPELHWLDVPVCIHYKLVVNIHQCL